MRLRRPPTQPGLSPTTMTFSSPIFTHRLSANRAPVALAAVPRVVMLALVALALALVTAASPAMAASFETASPAPQSIAPGKRIGDSTEALISNSAAKALAALNQYEYLSSAKNLVDLSAQTNDLAVHIAVTLGVVARDLQSAWANTDLAHQRAIFAGLSQVGVPYRINTAIPLKGFDCSGLTLFAWGVAGIELARGSKAQFDAATKISTNDAQPGDLLWRQGHIAMYLGVPGAVLQAPYGGRSVEVQMMNERVGSRMRYANPAI